MLSLLFMCCLIGLVGKLFFFGIRAAWGLTKFFFVVAFWPLILVALVLIGLIHLAFPLLLIFGIVALLKTATE
ncbi:MAG: hypothetical protein K6A30_09440 [Lachnospiraceae bacterium]|nr:hypothetical protein [Lachnospiraceae bacterium]